MGFLEALNNIKSKVLYTKEVDFLGSTISLRLLTMEDEGRLSKYDASTDPDNSSGDYFSEIKKILLANAINSIDGEVVPEIVILSNSGDKDIRKTKELFLVDYLSSIPSVLVDNLFEAYLDFKEECGAKITEDFKWEWYKTPEEREEEYKKKLKKSKEEPEESTLEDEEENKLDPIKFTEIRNKDEDNRGGETEA